MCKGKHWFLAGLLFVLILMLIGWNGQAQSQEKYPTRAIDIIIGGSPGGSLDLNTRLVAAYLSKKWGVPLNVINKPGGNSIPAMLEAYKATPDGYTMIGDPQAFTSMLAVSVKNLPFKLMDRTFVAVYSAAAHICIVAQASPFKTIKDLVDEIKRKPENISYASMGGAAGQDYCVRQLYDKIGVDFSKANAVMTPGGSDSASLVAGGHVTISFNTTSTTLPSVRAGTLRPLAITSKNRFPDLPDVPTTAELGYPTVNCVNWLGISGPPKVPSNIVNIWDKAIQEMMKDPEFLAKLRNIGAAPFYHNQQAMIELIESEIKEAGRLYK